MAVARAGSDCPLTNSNAAPPSQIPSKQPEADHAHPQSSRRGGSESASRRPLPGAACSSLAPYGSPTPSALPATLRPRRRRLAGTGGHQSARTHSNPQDGSTISTMWSSGSSDAELPFRLRDTNPGSHHRTQIGHLSLTGRFSMSGPSPVTSHAARSCASRRVGSAICEESTDAAEIVLPETRCCHRAVVDAGGIGWGERGLRPATSRPSSQA
jgi:hypothetical protein